MNQKRTLNLFMLAAAAALASQSPAFGAPSARIMGGWELRDFLVSSPSGASMRFCAGATGLLLYGESGHMSVSINCGASDGHPTPADEYGRMLFYAGTYEIAGPTVVHHITQSSTATLIDQTVSRQVARLTPDSLVLTGAFGSHGESLRIEWRRPAPRAAFAPDGQLGLLTYLKLKPGTADSFRRELAKIIEPSLSEAGNIAWFVQSAEDDPSDIVFYTRWLNQAALDAHLQSAPLIEYIHATAELLEPGFPRLVRYHPLDLATP